MQAHRMAAPPGVRRDRNCGVRRGDRAPRVGRHERLVAESDHDGVGGEISCGEYPGA